MQSKQIKGRATLTAAVVGIALMGAAHASAQVTLFAYDGFAGPTVRAVDAIPNLARIGFNDRASSLVVEGGRWEVCDDARFSGHCVVLRRGRYDNLQAIGLDHRISSLRAVSSKAANYDRHGVYYAASGDDAYRNDAHGNDAYRRRAGERLYEVPVTSARAVVGPPEQRCWVEQEQVVDNGSHDLNVPGAIAGAVIGGILGHQIGGGRGQDIATAGGAVGGAALGANVGRGGGQNVTTRDVQRCTNVGSERPDYWDVTYVYRGLEHRVQMSAAPGRTILVNGDGEPRV